MRILGIDPGLSITGYGVVDAEKNQLTGVAYGGIRTRSRPAFAEKLLEIFLGIREVIEQFAPDACAVEDVFYHQNKKTAIVMGHARAVAMLAAVQSGIPVFEYSPREVKMSIVGNGAASKEQVQAMVKNLLHLDVPPRPDDAADALAVALCHYHRARFLGMMSAHGAGK